MRTSSSKIVRQCIFTGMQTDQISQNAKSIVFYCSQALTSIQRQFKLSSLSFSHSFFCLLIYACLCSNVRVYMHIIGQDINLVLYIINDSMNVFGICLPFIELTSAISHAFNITHKMTYRRTSFHLLRWCFKLCSNIVVVVVVFVSEYDQIYII